MKFVFKDACVNKRELDRTLKQLEPYRRELAKIAKRNDYKTPESSIHLPFDDDVLTNIKALMKKKRTRTLRYVVVVGIGGSNLGTKAVYDAIENSQTESTKILFLDTVSSVQMSDVIQTLKLCKNKNDFAIVSISKSGVTMETIANTEVLLGTLKKSFGNVLDRVTVITNRDSRFWNAANDRDIDTLEIPAGVGGRFSIFSPVGLFPLALAGVNIEKLREGARDATSDKSAIISSALTYLRNKKGDVIHNTFLFAPELESLGKWYRQLMAESIGKRGVGIIPIVSIGTTDMHSIAQLFFGGPKNVFTRFVVVSPQTKTSVPRKQILGSLVDHIEDRSLDELMHVTAQGTRHAYTKHRLPFTAIELERINEKTVGAYMQWHMIEIMCLARLLQVNAFDQPAVEFYKKEVRKIL